MNYEITCTTFAVLKFWVLDETGEVQGGCFRCREDAEEYIGRLRDEDEARAEAREDYCLGDPGD